ncbi:lysostaphin resistance A-like protein [Aerococcaceae bacterium WGS1372]
MKHTGISLMEPWPDQVKGSWWKAPLIILVYFVSRMFAEAWVIGKGASNAQIELTVDTISDVDLIELMAYASVEYFVQTLLLTLLVILACRFFKFKFFDFKSFTLTNILKAIGFYVVIYLIQIIFTIIITVTAPDYTQPDNQAAVESMVQNMGSILMFINIVILTPITEEYLLRGLIMKYTFSLMPMVGAAVAAIVFTLLHAPANWIDFFLYFILSAGFTFVYWYTRRLEYPIFLHIIQNFIGFMAIQLV